MPKPSKKKLRIQRLIQSSVDARNRDPEKQHRKRNGCYAGFGEGWWENLPQSSSSAPNEDLEDDLSANDSTESEFTPSAELSGTNSDSFIFGFCETSDCTDSFDDSSESDSNAFVSMMPQTLFQMKIIQLQTLNYDRSH